MKFKRGNTHKRVGLSVGVLAMALCLLVPGPRGKALAASSGDTMTAVAASVAGVIAVPAIAYFMWVNRPNQTGERVRIPGEMYVGGFLGASFVQNGDWSFGSPVREGEVDPPITLKGVKYDPNVVGGVKFGYFCNRYPWFGLEAETNYTNAKTRQQVVNTTREVNDLFQAQAMEQTLRVWTSSLKLMARYGFYPDQEVPFGRLQPYVGIGPAFVVIYGQEDSAKNFGLDVQAGVRYMMLKNVSAFVEYKFTKQWAVELEQQSFFRFDQNRIAGTGAAKLDFDAHKVVAGVTYHF